MVKDAALRAERARRSGIFTIAVLFCLFGILQVVSAQDFPVEPGVRIRLTVPCDLVSPPASEQRRIGCAFTGELAGLQTDTIDLTVDGIRHSYNFKAVQRLEVSRGDRSHWLLGAGIGLAIGAGSTYLVLHHGGSTSLCNQSANQDALRSSECRGLVGVGGLVGAGLGALIGGRIRTERWQSIPYGRLRISFAPQDAFMLGLAMTF